MSQMEPDRAVLPAGLAGFVRGLGEEPTPEQLHELAERVDETVMLAFQKGDEEAELDAHRFLYDVHAHRILPPWSPHWHDFEHPAVQDAHRRLSAAWLALDRHTFGTDLEVPATPDGFARWAQQVCAGHASGPRHPLFDFLEYRAAAEQLRTFLAQETPFDIHFGDLVALLLPGVHGEQKTEMADNFWDEMGQGNAEATHRQLRLTMMSRVGIPADAHLTAIDGYWVEELRLANMYFQTATDRRLAPQAVGMLLATELVVPGRIDRQVAGWRRVGLADAD